MRVFTPREVAEPAMSKYLGVLIAAKYARELNAMPREAMPMDEKKLTTKALEALTSDHIEYRLHIRGHGTE
jgi:DNA-directed RNA polymerase subunit K/omega